MDLTPYSLKSPYFPLTMERKVFASLQQSVLYQYDIPVLVESSFKTFYRNIFQTLVPQAFQDQDPFKNQRALINQFANGGGVMSPYHTISQILKIDSWPFPDQFDAFPLFPQPDNLQTQRWTQTLNGASSIMYRRSFFPAPRASGCCIIPFHNENHITLLYVYGQFGSDRPIITKVCYADPAGLTTITPRLAKLICMTLEYAAACRKFKPDFSQVFKRADRNGDVKYEFLNIDQAVLTNSPSALDSMCYTICQLAFILFYRRSQAPQGYFESHTLPFIAFDDFFLMICQQHHRTTQTSNPTSIDFRLSIPCYIEMLDLPSREGHKIFWNPVGSPLTIQIDNPAPIRKREIKEESKEISRQSQIISSGQLPQRLQPSADRRELLSINETISRQATIIFSSIVRFEQFMQDQTQHHSIPIMLNNIKDAIQPYVVEVIIEKRDLDEAFRLLFKDLTELFIATGFRTFAFPYQLPPNAPRRSIEQITYPYRRRFDLDELQAGFLHQVQNQQAVIMADQRILARQNQPDPNIPVEDFILQNIAHQPVAQVNPPPRNNYLIIEEEVQIQGDDNHRDSLRAMQVPDRSPFEYDPFDFFGDQLVLRPIDLLVKLLIQRYNSCQHIRQQFGDSGYYSIKIVTYRYIQGQARVFPFYLIVDALTVKRSSFSELRLIISEYISKYIRSIFEEYNDVDSLDVFQIQFQVNGWKWTPLKPSMSHNIRGINIRDKFLATASVAFSWFNNFSNLVHRFYTNHYLNWGPKYVNSEWAIDLEYLEDSQYYIVQLSREEKSLRSHPIFQGQPCLQILCNIVLSFSIIQNFRFTQEEQSQINTLKERGEQYVHWLQESRLNLMDTQSLRGNAKSFMKGLIEQTKESLKKLNENPSLPEFIGIEGIQTSKFIFDRLSLGEFGQRITRSQKYEQLQAHCVNGKTIPAVNVLNQIISELRSPFKVFFMSIHSLVKCIKTTPTVQQGVEKIFNMNQTIRAINTQLQMDNYLQAPPLQSDFVFLTTTDHALLFKVAQLTILAQHVFTQSFCKNNSLKRAYEQHCLLFKDNHNLDGMFFKMSTKKVNPSENMTVSLLSDIELAQKHINERTTLNAKFIERYSTYDFLNYFTGDIKIQHFSELNDNVKSQLLVYLTNKKLMYKFDDQVVDLYSQDQYYFQSIFQAIQIPNNLNFKPGLNMGKFVSRQRQMKFCATGLLAFDCETFTLNSQRNGNQHVWCVSVYGRARCLNKPPNAPLELIDKVFTGINAMDDFVDYLLFKGIILSITDEQQCKNFIALQLSNGKVSPNTIYAHNGNKFDFKLLIQSLQRVTKVNTVGSLTQLKKLSTIGCQFMDSILLLNGSLSKLCQTYNPYINTRFTEQNCTSPHEKFILKQFLSHKSVQKATFDVKGYSFQDFTSDMAQRARGSCPKLDEFEAYCRLDSVSLYFIVHVFFEMNYSLPFQRTSQGGVTTCTFLPTMFPLSTASLSTEVYKLAYSKHILRPNKKALEIERKVFCGGFTSLFQTRIKLGAAMDVNSSYATAMQNPLPAFH